MIMTSSGVMAFRNCEDAKNAIGLAHADPPINKRCLLRRSSLSGKLSGLLSRSVP